MRADAVRSAEVVTGDHEASHETVVRLTARG
jgi:hypothetical protein